jgi:DNA-binding LytR/AlgR family response regulator
MRCLVIDDEPRALEVLQTHIAALPMLRLVGTCANAMAAFEALQREALRGEPVDVMFLDITMPRLTGLDFLRSLERPPLTILTTAYHEYALQGYELDVVDYLMKPISFQHFLRAVQKAARRLHLPDLAAVMPASPAHAAKGKPSVLPASSLSSSSDVPPPPADERFLYFRVDRKMVKVFVRDICVVESLKDYVRIITSHHAHPSLITKQSMNALELMLPSEEFVRVHRSFIVAVKKITSYTASMLEVQTATQQMSIPIGRNFKAGVRESLEGSTSGEE